MTRPTESNRINIVRKIGQGGQGAVFEAIAPNGDTVAVKRFTPPSGTPEAVLENYRTRFRREIEVTSRLAHRNIVEVLSDNLNSDVPYYVMTWAETTLAAVISNNPQGMPAKQALSLMIEVCQGMAYAHANDALHRDIKPENVLIIGGIPKIADFGLGRSLDSASATLTQSQIGWGTVYYVAPEQMTSLHDAKKPADVYSLGVVLFQMTTGLPPHQARIQANLAPAELRFIVSKCLRDDPNDRYADAGELLAALQKAQSADPSKQAPPKQRAEAALNAFTAGDSSAIDVLADILQNHTSDSQLYSNFLPDLPLQALKALPHLSVIVKHYDEYYAEGNGTFVYADVIAKFYERCLKVVQALDLRAQLLSTLLEQGYANNRFFVGQTFGRICDSIWNDPVQAQLVADVLGRNRPAHDFVRVYFEGLSLPAVVNDALSPDHAVEPNTAQRDPWGTSAEDPWGEKASPSDPFAPDDDPWNVDPWENANGE